ncbi:DUF433 domain-containing protein [Candidatus Parcubacteria bacterium]|nr:MAG: DUF433 domain-containing protein [Candidatus Parcubacteria bacterium]
MARREAQYEGSGDWPDEPSFEARSLASTRLSSIIARGAQVAMMVSAWNETETDLHVRGDAIMARIEIGEYLAVDTRVCGGRLIFKGTRILVSDALQLMDAGYTPEEVANQYRGLVTPKAVCEARSLTRRGLVREVSPKAKAAA